MNKIRFTKMHGLGNDFVIIDRRKEKPFDFGPYARKISDRKQGIGCDQLLIVEPSSDAYANMVIFNNDGSRAQTCGNGLRCLASYLREKDSTSKDELLIETLAGVRKVIFHSENDLQADMGIPVFEPESIPVKSEEQVINRPHEFGKINLNISCVSIGNPHCVVLGDEPLLGKIAELGPLIENDPFFPRRVNVEFVRVKDRGNIEIRIWERGAGLTRACGSGAVASMVVCNKLGLVEENVEVVMPGGDLLVTWDGKTSACMRGPVKKVFEGTIDFDSFRGRA